jgi:hypothetical protein
MSRRRSPAEAQRRRVDIVDVAFIAAALLIAAALGGVGLVA